MSEKGPVIQDEFREKGRTIPCRNLQSCGSEEQCKPPEVFNRGKTCNCHFIKLALMVENRLKIGVRVASIKIGGWYRWK